MDTKATVCVIGASITGLVTAKTLAQDGFDRDRELLVVSLLAHQAAVAKFLREPR